MPDSIGNQIDRNPVDQTFGLDPIQEGIDLSENDPMSDRANNIGYGSDKQELPTVNVEEDPIPSTGVQNLGSSTDEFPESNSPSETGDGESQPNGKIDILTGEPLNSDPSSLVNDAQGDLPIDPEDPSPANQSDDTTEDPSPANQSDDTTEDPSPANESDDTTEDPSPANQSDDTTEDPSPANQSDDTTEDPSPANESDNSATDNDDTATDDATDVATGDDGTNVVEDAASSDTPIDFDIGSFTVDTSGEVGIDFIFDGGGFGRGQISIVSRSGMEHLDPTSVEFRKEAATRAASNSELGHIVIDDSSSPRMLAKRER